MLFDQFSRSQGMSPQEIALMHARRKVQAGAPRDLNAHNRTMKYRSNPALEANPNLAKAMPAKPMELPEGVSPYRPLGGMSQPQRDALAATRPQNQMQGMPIAGATDPGPPPPMFDQFAHQQRRDALAAQRPENNMPPKNFGSLGTLGAAQPPQPDPGVMGVPGGVDARGQTASFGDQFNEWMGKGGAETLMGLGTGLLSMSGPSSTPVSMGQALGAGAIGATNAMAGYKAGQRQDGIDARQQEIEARQADLDRVRLALAEKQLNAPDTGPTPPSDVREYQFAQSQGFEGSFIDYQLAQRRAGAANTTVTVSGDSVVDRGELSEQLGGAIGKQWAGYLEQADVAAGKDQTLEYLGTLVNGGTMPQGPVTGRLLELAPGTTDASAAFTAAVNELLPGLRAPGSGAQSDKDIDVIKGSLPRLQNNAEANRLIIAALREKAAIEIERGRIVNSVFLEEMTQDEAMAALRDLNQRSILTPEVRAALDGVAPQNATSSPGGSTPQRTRIYDPETDELR